MTRALVPTGARVIAVEPVAGMRASSGAAAPGAEVLAGTAEAIPLANGSVDGSGRRPGVPLVRHGRGPCPSSIGCWRPDGRLVLAWNKRDESVPWVRRLGEHDRAAHGRRDARASSSGWQERLARSALFEPAESTSSEHVHRLDRSARRGPGHVDQHRGALEPSAQAALVAEVQALLAADPRPRAVDVVPFPYVTILDRLVRRSPVPGSRAWSRP